MKELALVLIVLSAEVCIASVCKTNDKGTKKNTPCVFPFKFQQETYHSCTNASDPKGNLWCSTKVDPDGYHLKGNWGFCDMRGKDPLQVFKSESTCFVVSNIETTAQLFNNYPLCSAAVVAQG